MSGNWKASPELPIKEKAHLNIKKNQITHPNANVWHSLSFKHLK
jgi:hypothetical protein